MKKKYYKLIDNEPIDTTFILAEFKGAKRERLFEAIKNAPFLLIEKTIFIENGTEEYSNLIPVFDKNNLLKTIKNNTCYDYTEVSLKVWYNKIKFTWEEYKILNTQT